MSTCLSTLAKLELLSLGFRSPSSQDNQEGDPYLHSHVLSSIRLTFRIIYAYYSPFRYPRTLTPVEPLIVLAGIIDIFCHFMIENEFGILTGDFEDVSEQVGACGKHSGTLVYELQIALLSNFKSGR